MMPGMNPRMMKQAMKRMGIKQVEIEANEVIIKTNEKEIVISNPSVSKVNMMGQETWQVVGEAVEKELDASVEISEEDIKTVVEQTGVSVEKAKEIIEKNEGDLAAAIMELQSN
jgi:nascent polypeptide-associated complex subunit alpha